MDIQKFLKSSVMLITFCMLIVSANSWSREAAPPQDVQALIGKKIPAAIKGKASGSIPDFLVLSSTGINVIVNGRNIELRTGVTAGGSQVSLVIAKDADFNTEILDALLLPPDLIDWYVAGDKNASRKPQEIFKWRKGRFTLSEDVGCRKDKKDTRFIVGLVKPEKGKETCSHYSRRVRNAWLLNTKSGRFEAISTQNLSCLYLVEDDCN